ncbi:MAG TPA: LuxR C-terminal-related transcriptional regulator [Candidatus Limnocylindria bacterium]|nr:LuxR C-terminal-related transcriptional regulator [Candidatus Limnocylindria bacterium]
MSEALAALEVAAAELEADDPAGAARLRIDAVQIGLMAAGPDRALALAEAAVDAARGTDPAIEAAALTRLGDALSWAGRYDEAAGRWREAATFTATPDPSLACERANAALRGGDLRLARDLVYEAVVRARSAESHDDLIDALTIASIVEIHLGHLREAFDSAEQALDLTSTDDVALHTAALGLVAWVAALLGDRDRCSAAIAEAGADLERHHVTAPGGFAAGMLALSEARYDDAVRAFEGKTVELPLHPVAQALGIRPFVPSLVEAYARAGRGPEAQRLLDQFFDAAMATGQPRHVAPALRAKGVSTGELAPLDAALAAHAAWGNRFEEARTLLARGELLRRVRRPAEARVDLRGAVDRFEQAGALLWRERAVTELRAAGDRRVATMTPGTGPERLTQAEATVAALVIEGLTNREIADRLFLSVKTVEARLTTIYGKLGVRSRAQLTATGIGRRQDGHI